VWTEEGTDGVPGNPEMRDLGTFGGNESKAFAINEKGHITGYAETRKNAHAFIYRGEVMVDIADAIPGLPNSFGFGINEQGHVAGAAYNAGYSSSEAFLYDGQVAHLLGDLSGGDSFALDLNDSDEVVGYSGLSRGVVHAFRYSSGEMEDLGTLGGDWSYAQAINDYGSIVGGSFIEPDNEVYHAFIYEEGVMADLNSELDTSGMGWELIEAYDINDAGQIVGVGTYENQQHIFRLTPVTLLPPEITGQPGDVTVECQSEAALEVVAVGESMTYQWFRGIPPDGEPLLDADQAGLVLSVATLEDAGSYYVVVANRYGATTSLPCLLEVVDTVSPEITGCPSDFTIEVPIGSLGGTVSWHAPEATDGCVGSVPVDCEPASGSWFPLSETTVSCVANDGSGNTSRCSFTVTVVETAFPLVTIECSQDGSMLALSFPTFEGSNYQVESTPNLNSLPWEPVTDLSPGTGEIRLVNLPLDKEPAQRFYRVSMIWR